MDNRIYPLDFEMLYKNTEKGKVRVYKYIQEPNFKRDIETFFSGSIYLGKVTDFNDPWDFPLCVDMAGSGVFRFLNYAQDKGLLSNYTNNNFGIISDDAHLFNIFDAINSLDRTVRDKAVQEYLPKNSIVEYIFNRYSSLGIFCASLNNNDYLMWSHYGGGHTGIQVTLELDVNPFERVLDKSGDNLFLAPINYSSEMPFRINSISPHDLAIDSILDQLRHKHLSWSYENEIRVFSMKGGMRNIGVKVVEVTFGYRCKSINEKAEYIENKQYVDEKMNLYKIVGMDSQYEMVVSKYHYRKG